MSTKTGFSIHRAIVHSVDVITNTCQVYIPVVTGKNTVSVPPLNLPVLNNGTPLLPSVGQTCLVAIDSAGSVVHWVTGADSQALLDAIEAASGGIITDHGTLLGLGDDDHPQYLNNSRGDVRYEPIGAVAAHASAGDPHPQYLTETEGDALYDALGTGASEAATTMAAHYADGDPHPQYGLVAGETWSGTHTHGGTDNFTGTKQVGGTTARMLIEHGQAVLSSNLDTTTSAQDIVGCTSGSLSLTAGDLVIISGIFDVRIDVTAITFVGTLDINGNEQALQALFKSTDAADRATVAQTWYYSVPSTTTYTFKLRGRTSSGGSGDAFVTAHTSITWQVFR